MALVLTVAIGGFFRGTVRQIFSLLGVIAAALAVSWTSQWVGHQWQGARPAVFFLALRWLVALLAGLVLVALFDWMGARMAESLKNSSLAWLDRIGGFAVGAMLGVVWAATLLIVVLLVARPPEVLAAVRASRLGDPVLRRAQQACVLGERVIPGSKWLERRIDAARHETKAGSP